MKKIYRVIANEARNAPRQFIVAAVEPDGKPRLVLGPFLTRRSARRRAEHLAEREARPAGLRA